MQVDQRSSVSTVPKTAVLKGAVIERKLPDHYMDRSVRDDFEIRERCPSCTSALMEPLLRHPFDQRPIRNYLISHYEGRAELHRLAGTALEVDRCRNCGLIFQRTVPSGALLGDIYERWISPEIAQKSHRERCALHTRRYLVGQVDFLIQHFKLRPADIDVFDFGFGWAEWICVARSFGCNVAGAELSKERMDYARSIGIKVIDWDDIPHHRFHFINTEQVFEHLIQPRETLEHLIRGLRPEGILKISVPNGRGISAHVRRVPKLTSWPYDRLMPIAPLEHVNCFDYPSLVRLGRELGLRPVRPRLRHLYNAASGWLEPREFAKNLLRPIYRHVYPKSTFVYFSRMD